MWSLSHSHKIAVWKSWCLSPYNHQRHQHFVIPVSYHPIWKLLVSNPCWKNNPMKKLYWQTIDHSQTYVPFLSKILEKVVLHQVLSNVQENNLCNSFPSAYSAGHSTEFGLLRIVNDLLTAIWTKTQLYILVLLALSAAFDTIFGIHSTACTAVDSIISAGQEISSFL